MKACLDPNVAVLSPSLESRFLVGVALSTTLGLLSAPSERTIYMTEVSPDLVEVMPSVENAAPSLLDYIASVVSGDEVDFILGSDIIPAIFGFVESFIQAFLNFIGFIDF